MTQRRQRRVFEVCRHCSRFISVLADKNTRTNWSYCDVAYKYIRQPFTEEDTRIWERSKYPKNCILKAEHIIMKRTNAC